MRQFIRVTGQMAPTWRWYSILTSFKSRLFAALKTFAVPALSNLFE